jgi:PAS domain S-box-containing protein
LEVKPNGEPRHDEALLTALLDGAPIGIAVFDREFRYVRVNGALAAINGSTVEQMLGRRISDVVPSIAPFAEAFFRRVLDTGEPLPNREIYAETPKQPGVRRHFLVSYYPIKVSGEIVGLASLVNEITARKRVEQVLRVLATSGDTLTTSLDLRATVSAALRLLVPDVATAAIVNLVDDGTLSHDDLLIAHATPSAEPALLDLWRSLSTRTESVLSEVLRTRRSVIIEPTDEVIRGLAGHGPAADGLRGQGWKSLLIAPLVSHGKSLGTMTAAAIDRAFDETDRELAVELGHRIGSAIENARNLEVAERRGEQLQRLQSFTSALATVRTLREVAEVILRRGRLAFQAQRGILCLFSRDAQALEAVHAEGYTDEHLASARRIPLARHVPLTDAARLATPLFFRSRDELLLSYPELADGGTGSNALLALPLFTHTRPIGALGLEMDAPHDFNPEEEADLLAFASLCAQAIERALLSDLADAERRRAEEANRMKDEFLAVLSHEIRTPLNAIMGWARMLAMRTLDASQTSKAIATIERNARAQAQLVEDLLDVSRIVTGKLKINVDELSLVRVIEAAADVVRPAAAAKDVKIEIDLDERVNRMFGDSARLQQIVWNLLSNAVKFTDRGGRVFVRTSVESGSCILTVEDTGQGIAADFLPYIFERFRQADMGSSRTHGGLGLGLAIVRHLVEAHGGAVEAFSEGVGRGATFVVRLPMAPALRVPSSVPPPPGTQRSFGPLEHADEVSGLHVLVVDDEPDARDLIAELLRYCNVQVSIADAAAPALAIVAGERPDVIVSDIGMPGDDGYDLVRSIRKLGPDAGGRTPAIALTAYARIEDRTKALLAGFNAHVPKPIDPSELIVAIAHVAGRLKVRDEGSAPRVH